MRRTVWLLLAALLVAGAIMPADGMAQAAPASMANVLTPAEDAEGWKLLFDGKTLLGWIRRGGSADWKVEDGVITAVATGGPSYIGTASEYTNFHLKADFWQDEGHNSGIFIRGPREAEAPVNQKSFYEINISDDHKTFPTGSIVELHRFDPVPKTAGKWNTYEITAEGDHLVVKLNGTTTVDLKDGAHYSGVIALQAFGTGKVRFRNVKVHPLK